MKNPNRPRYHDPSGYYTFDEEADYWKNRWEKENDDKEEWHMKVHTEIQASREKIARQEMEGKMEEWVKEKEKKPVKEKGEYSGAPLLQR